MIRKGQRYRAKHDIGLPAIITYGAPCSGSFQGALKKGDLITVESDPPPKAKAVYAKPDRYEEIELEYVPERVRNDPEYGDYAFVVSFADIENHFEEIE